MHANEEIRVLIADDEPGMRMILRKMIAKAEGFTLCAEATSGQQMLELVEEYRSKGLKSQVLLIPVTVDFDPLSFDVVTKNFDVFSNLGFECEEFGDKSIIVRAVPSAMADSEIKDVICEITELLVRGTSDIKKTFMDDVLHTMACKRAIKGNTILTREEMETLASKVLSFEWINTCPHGRPIITSMTKYELEKNFKRIV